MSHSAPIADFELLEHVVGGDDYGASYDDASSYSEPTYSEPSYSEPTYSEPSYSEPTYSEPSYSQPTYSESSSSSPTYDPTYEESSYAGQSYGMSSSGDGYDQLAGLSGERNSSAPGPTLLGESNQRFDDGTSLTTYNWDTGTVVRSNEQQIQMFDDGSRLITDNYTTRTAGSSAPPETTSRTWSVDSLDARLNSSDLGYYLDHPATATQTDIFTAQDVLRNYDDRLPGYARDGLNDYINGYYTGTPPPVFGGEPPTPRPSPGLYPATGFG